MLSTVQQTSLGLGTALLGAVFTQVLNSTGEYLQALRAGLLGEFVLMLIVAGLSLNYWRRQRHSAGLRTAE